ncbi:hypothetical protein BC826DRAFT_1177260 [Russula brevipes]|nr:hypothetical protein BC826DRAFT_1177260 [Russula brevipes]
MYNTLFKLERLSTRPSTVTDFIGLQFLPASSTTVGQPVPATEVNRTSSEPIGGVIDTSISAVETSLAALKEASVLIKHVPWISPVAGLLLQVLNIRNGMKQYEEEWDVVMEKLKKIAHVVGSLGEKCKTYNLEEKDLPSGLRGIFQSLETDLDKIKSSLKKSKDIRGIKKVLFRMDLLQKIKEYDGKLANVLQIFQVELTLDIRLAQLAEEYRHGVTQGGPSRAAASSDIVVLISRRSMPCEPRSPQIFFGRDAELAEIIRMVLINPGSHPARIAILGPGGYGKTTLANAVLTHERVREHFGEARYFVACESVVSSDALLVEIAKTLGLLDAAMDVSWPRIRAALNRMDCILCLDNFESPWDKDGDTKSSVEELLSRVTELHRTTVLITMRGIMRPALTQWTMPLLPPLITLDGGTAKRVWEGIAPGSFDKFAKELITAVDYVPLAVTLLAHLAQATPAESLLEEWNKKQTRFIHRDLENKDLNLECSIQLSIDSVRMSVNPSAKKMLGVLSMLPDGMHKMQIEQFQKMFLDIDISSGIRNLTECSLISMMGERYQSHPIIQNYCKNHIQIDQKNENSLGEFYINLASIDSCKAQASKHAEMVLEVNNTKAILFGLLKSDFGNITTRLVNAICAFTSFCSSIGDHSDQLISQTVQLLKQRGDHLPLLIECLKTWGRLYYHADNLERAKQKIKEAEVLCEGSQENKGLLHANILFNLGDMCLLQRELNEAETSYSKALEFYKLANNVWGQGKGYFGLGDINLQLGKLNDAEASYQKALEFHKLANSVLGQGNDYLGLGDINLQLGKLNDAEASYQKALEFHKLANDVLGQGNDYLGLGDINLQLGKLNDAEASYQKALEFHKLANDVLGQGNDYKGLGDINLQLGKLNDAEASYQKALEFHKLANDVLGQGNDYKGLGDINLQLGKLNDAEASYHKALQLYKVASNSLARVQMKRSKWQDAKSLLDDALLMHKQAQSLIGQKRDQHCLNEVLSKMAQP